MANALGSGNGFLAGHVYRFGESEGKATALIEVNHSRRIARFAGCRDASLAPRKKTGGLNWQISSSHANGVQGQANVVSVALDSGCSGGLHSTRNIGAARDERHPLQGNCLIYNGFEASRGIGSVGPNGILQPN